MTPPVRTSFLPPLVPGRVCGECVACCEILNIDAPELKKPARVMCVHCTGSGCGIYEARPAPCRDFHCLWRRIAAMPDRFRPDRLGVAFSLDQHSPPRMLFEAAYFVGRAVKGPEAFEREEVREAVEMFARGSPLPVFLSWGGGKRLVHPAPELALVITGEAPPASAEMAAAAREWLARYAPIARAAGAGAFLPEGL